MRYIFYFLILATLSASAQNLKQGGNLKAEFEKINNPYYFKAPEFSGWVESRNMILIGDKPNPNDCDFVFLALQDTTVIGAFINKEAKYFLLDMEGNSTLSVTSNYFLLPMWTVKRNAKVISSDTTILLLLDKIYEKTLQANQLELDEKTIKEYGEYKSNTTLANRHIALLFDNYQTIINETSAKGEKAPAEICIPLMKSLSAECLSLYNRIPVIVCIYMGEALQSAGMIDEAREHFKLSLQFYPNSIPLLVNEYRLEKDPIKQKEKLAKLKSKYPEHWMVMEL
ncbi:MAG TPA: hypothetical protein PLI47_06290 [Bacteroidia bacterium]|nr:hypothetical protein [Bacteroidota bacterium]MBP9790518.1 hypothetical protein [Bacteroidia bacterium]MBK7429450.1 hypothetical protein [Bacteroidota bacterium]MBK7572491.1 hypothetical protein [Bacteroidota bacterium]MBP9923824.1 hypothetical protein [Bacteroidia bacterium]